MRTFFDELKNGTRNYRTVASLSGQITQEYRGRCVLELLQNAHDALGGARPDDPRQISFVLVTEPEPVLLIANSGRPFRQKDFEGICQLGQSPKDPNESVGNKGLGFQSVLEVSTRPQIWSTTAEAGDAEFVFGFDPAGTKRLVEQALTEIESGLQPPHAATGRQIINWSEEQLHNYQERNRSGEALDAAREARRYVSPYSIPLPVDETPPEVGELLDAGHVTVIRLPLDGGRTGAFDRTAESIGDSDRARGTAADRRRAVDEAVESIRDQLDRLDARSAVFLPDLERLTINVDGDSRVLERIVYSTADLPGSRPAHEQLLLVGRSAGNALDDTTREFRVWTRGLGGDGDPAEARRIQDAVKHLPNRWPEVRQVEVGVAVEDSSTPEPGTFVIFLPTEVGTGTGAHINTPFYGSLDRRQINFKDEYNALLLEYVKDLALDVVTELAARPPEGWRARAVVDLLGSAAAPGGGVRPSLMDQPPQTADETGRDVANAKLILCDRGWRDFRSARIMPEVPGDDPLGEVSWRKGAEFAILSSELDGRHTEVKALLKCFGGSPAPTQSEWAATIERIAARLHSREIEASWDEFLSSLLAVLPQQLRSLRGRGAADPLCNAKFLPTQDGRLLCASDDNAVRIFFQPLRGLDDAAEFVGRIPASLQDRIAFLHDGVKTHEGPQRQNTEVQKFLDGRFVQGFRREDLVRDVVLPALPELPVPHGGSEANRCAEILKWTLALIGNEESQTLAGLLKRLPVACHGGWFAAGEAVFGPGWIGRHGESVQTLAEGLPADSNQLLEKALLPPQDPRWGLDAEASNALFESSGVIDGLPIRTAEPVHFFMSASYRELPREAPEATPQTAWDDWLRACGDELKPEIKSRTSYKLDDIYLATEIHSLRDLEAPAREALSDLIISSLEAWDDDWESAQLTRPRYPANRWPITSPLKHWLTTLPWLHENELEPGPLCQRWFVPESLLRGQGGRFAHLAPLSLKLAHRLGENPELRAKLERLGLNVYPTEDERTGPELLEALADAWDKGAMPAGGFDVFLGQVRHAWKHLDPDRGLPGRFLIRTRPRAFQIVTDPADAYLPDDEMRTRSLRDHQKPILEMRPVRSSIGALLDELKVPRASDLDEYSLADGRPAAEEADRAVPIEDTEVRWLPLVLLTLAAHGGANPRGPATKAWQNAAARLRGARVHACGSLSVELMDADKVVASSEPSAHWLPDEGTLLLRHGSPYDELAPPSQAILERQDLLKDLRLVLGALAERAPEPTQDQIEEALDKAEIDAEAFADIRHRWHGNTAHVVERIRPVLKLLAIPADGLEAAAAETEALTKWLSPRLEERPTTGWSAEELISAARASRDDRGMGHEVWRNLGEISQLPAWNEALAELGDRYAACENGDAGEQTKLRIQEAALLLRALARQVAVEMRDADLFLRMEEASQDFEAPPDWSSRWWEVPFDTVLGHLRTAYVDELGVDSGPVDALDDASTLAELRAALVQQGIAVDVDPYETFRRNENRLEKEIGQVRDLHRAWLEVLETKPVPPRHEESGSPRMNASAYLRDWSEAEIFEQALETVNDAAFLRQCDGCRAVDEARAKLKVTAEVVEQARRKRRERQREEQRAQKTEVIAGKPFEVGLDSYGDLLARLDTLPELKGPSVKSDESTRLVQPGAGSSPKAWSPPASPGRTSHLYASPHLPVLVGIVGEMHAYRYLRSEFGSSVVTPAAWVSENSLQVLPLAGGEKRDASDSRGFDFRFASDGITWHFEVKATTEDDTSFSLPPSEIRAATRLANRGRDRWRILRIRSTLSDRPEIDLLPNPFEAGFSDLFRLSSGGMTVRYALDAAT